MLPKEQRLCRNSVEYLLRKGRLLRTKLFIVKHKPNREALNRFAVVVSGKVQKKAVPRNKLRRQIYEVIGNNIERLAKGSEKKDFIVIAKPNVNDSGFEDISKDIVHLFSLFR